jgi:acyl-coenzyme A thioesterase PaaI-like protein
MTPERDQAIQDTYDDASSWCYGCGRLNDEGLHLRTFVEGEEAVTFYVPDPCYTGGRDFLYGGLVASLIDCHSTATAAAAGYAAEGRAIGSEPRLRYVTASLKVDFVAPSPVGEPLEVRGKAIEVKGRKVVVESELRARGQVCARGHVVAVLYR